MDKQSRFYAMPFATVYPLYLNKVEKKGRTKEELDGVIYWLTGYDEKSLIRQIEMNTDFERFFSEAPQINANAGKVTGLICGYRVEEIEDRIVRLVRCLDKLVDELAKGKPMEKILRS